MIEPLMGSGTPMWTALPSTGFAFQTPMPLATFQTSMPVSSRPIGPQAFGSPNLSGIGNGWGAGPVGGPETMLGGTAPAPLAAVAMRRGQPQGPTNDQEVEDFLYDALELLPGASDVEVRCEGGRVTLTGTVAHK